MLTRAPKGTKDILPDESYKWQYIEGIMRDVCSRYAYREIRVPTFEAYRAFYSRCRRYDRYCSKRDVYLP